MSDAPFPEGFQALAAFPEWNLPTPDGRQQKRLGSSSEEIRRFYDGAVPHLEAMITELDRYPLGALPETHRSLFNIAMAIAEIAPNVELYRANPGVPFAFEESRFVAAHGDQATWSGKPPMDRDR